MIRFSTPVARSLRCLNLATKPLVSFSQEGRFFSSYPEHEVLGLPALSPTMQHGNLAAWKVKVGDELFPGTEMAEVETDKATVRSVNSALPFLA
jgi:hypothetical protein